jgi:hypothetical protein
MRWRRGVRTVELYLEQIDLELPLIQDGQTRLPEPQLRDTQIVPLEADSEQSFRFRLRGLDPGTHQGWVKHRRPRCVGLGRYPVFHGRGPAGLARAGARSAGVNTSFLTEAIAPYEFRQTGGRRTLCSVFEQAQLPNLVLDDYSAVCLLDPQPLTPPDWEKLARLPAARRGAGDFLGHNADPAAFNVAAATEVLGGRLVRQWRSAGDVFLAPRDLNHPITAAFREIADGRTVAGVPGPSSLGDGDLADHARTVIPFSNNQPAIIETSLDRGRGLTMTTPISDPTADLRGRQPWNELPTGTDAWPYSC